MLHTPKMIVGGDRKMRSEETKSAGEWVGADLALAFRATIEFHRVKATNFGQAAFVRSFEHKANWKKSMAVVGCWRKVFELEVANENARERAA